MQDPLGPEKQVTALWPAKKQHHNERNGKETRFFPVSCFLCIDWRISAQHGFIAVFSVVIPAISVTAAVILTAAAVITPTALIAAAITVSAITFVIPVIIAVVITTAIAVYVAAVIPAAVLTAIAAAIISVAAIVIFSVTAIVPAAAVSIIISSVIIIAAAAVLLRFFLRFLSAFSMFCHGLLLCRSSFFLRAGRLEDSF